MPRISENANLSTHQQTRWWKKPSPKSSPNPLLELPSFLNVTNIRIWLHLSWETTTIAQLDEFELKWYEYKWEVRHHDNDFKLTFQLHIVKTALLTTYTLNGFQLCLWLQGAKNFHIHLSLSEGLEDNHLHSEDCSFKLRNSLGTSRNSPLPQTCRIHDTAMICILILQQFTSSTEYPIEVATTQEKTQLLPSIFHCVTAVCTCQGPLNITSAKTSLRNLDLRIFGAWKKIPKWWFFMGSNQ